MKLLAIDGNSLINRAYYGVKPLTTKDGVFTNAVFGFTNILLHLLNEEKPDAVAVAFDRHEPTFRHKLYGEYKAGRHKPPEELLSQFPLVKELVTLWGFTCVDCVGFEADDILGTLAASCTREGWDCVLATGDRDSLQLVTDTVTVALAKNNETKRITPAEIRAEYGVEPRQLIEVKAIMGDTSDHYPGVKGIGEAGAKRLIASFGSLSGVYENLSDPSVKAGERKKLEENRREAELSRVLAEIVTDAPVEAAPAAYAVREPDGEGLRNFLVRYEMMSLIKRLPCEEKKPDADAPRHGAEEPHGPAAAFTLSGDLYAADEAGVPFVCDGLSLPAVTDDAKTAAKKGLPVSFDVSLAGYLLNPVGSDYSVPRLCELYGLPLPLCEGFPDNDAAARASVLPRLASVLREKLKEADLLSLYEEVELPLAAVLAEMETEGFRVDFAALTAFREQLTVELNEMEQKIYDYAEGPFSIQSPKQLGEVLFDKLGLPAAKKTKSGYSTDAETLDGLRGMHPIVDLVLQYRQYAKLRSTYCDGLQKARDEADRVHTTYNQTETRTGRISSSEPNLQNIPVRTPLGREMRRFFVAREGWMLVDADYSQIELRVLAHLSGDGEMCRAFSEKKDIHTRTATQIFGVEENQVTPLMRSRAKTVNCAIVYGIGAFSLAKDLHISRREAEHYIQSYFDTYPAMRSYMDGLIASAKETGYAVTMFNRRRPLPELTATNHATRAFGERVARNMPIQGTSADLIKLAMVRVSRRLSAEGLQAKLILQVHDELIVEAPEAEAGRVAALLAEEMEQVASLRVPLVADAHVGKSWFDAK